MSGTRVPAALERDTGRIHPGAVTVLADQCMGNAASGDRPRALVTLDLRIDWFSSPSSASAVRCEAKAIATNEKTVFVTADLLDGVDDRPIGNATGEFMLGAAAGGFTDIYSYEASLKKQRAGLSFVGIDSFEHYLEFLRSDIGYLLEPEDRFIGSPFLPAFHGGVTAAALRQAMWLEAQSWRPAFELHMLSWSTQFLLAGNARKSLHITVDWVRRGKNVARLQALAFQDGCKDAVAAAQATLVHRDSA